MHIVRQRLAQPSSPSTVNNKLKIYENYADRISIQYPSNWQIARAILKDDSGTQFSSATEFIYPLNNLFRFPPSVTITVEKLPQGMTLNQYMKRIDNVTSITYKTTPSISNVHPTFIQGTNATERIIGIQSSSFGLNLKVMQIFALEDGNVYTITYAAQAPDYEKYIDTAQTMIDSFRILTGLIHSLSLPGPNIEVFALGNNSDPYHLFTTKPGQWNPAGWQKMELGQLRDPRIKLSDLYPISFPDGSIEVFARGNNSYLYHAFTIAPGKWNPASWMSLGQQFP